MARRTLVLDGLWYSLCPSFIPRGLTRAAPLLRTRKQSARPYSPAVSFANSPPRRFYSSNPGEAYSYNHRYGHSAHPNLRGTQHTATRLQSPVNEHSDPRQNASARPRNRSKRSKAPKLPKQSPRAPKDLEERSTSNLETMLQQLMARSPSIRGTTQVLRILIRDRHVHPTSRHYKALFFANADSERGSPEFIRRLLDEMDDNNIATDSATLHAALQALAVHPDYLLRQEVLHRLRDRWLPLSPAGWNFIVAGLVREHQFELALDEIDMMERKEVFVENWLHSFLIYNLCDFNELDEVERLMRRRVDQYHEMTFPLWFHVLGAATEAHHGALTRYVWQQRVELGHLQPPAQLCRQVLALASRLGDPDLASSVFRFFSYHKISCGLEDYERLAEAHVGAGDLPGAFEVLCSMHEAGIALEESSTRAVVAYMIQSKIDRREAWQMLKRLKNVKRCIPIGCVRAIADLCEHDAQHDPSVADDGVGFYKELYTLCPEGADVRVYNALIRMCRRARNREAGMFIVKEMAAFGVVPNATTFETIILMCLDANNFRSAYMYFQDLVKRDASVSEEAQKEICEICSGSVDEFALRLQYHPQISARDDGQPTDVIEAPQPGRHPLPPAVRRQMLSPEERREWNKERRKEKRRRLAIERNMEEEGWLDWEADVGTQRDK
ncbi:hypothetical protein NUU61_010195 [Penicillium alfredii]|uniref:Pentatricopeptide repeat-containing protein-mitochondrial domain-containing protein n=1 Tax=Penicillium alfredii TaxID=1506179 RepID=A0A9W9JUG9_9EURO|nr:uncharacterized protein NUU61_010195 [Penicillium alfredii]KAJ5081931.1 hypothetical protein NUU61_010195 [Penicillium alfredii]